MLWFVKRSPEQWWPLISVLFLMFFWTLLWTKEERWVGHTLGPTRLWGFIWKQSDGHWPSRSAWLCNPANSVAMYWRRVGLRTSIRQMDTMACTDTSETDTHIHVYPSVQRRAADQTRCCPWHLENGLLSDWAPGESVPFTLCRQLIGSRASLGSSNIFHRKTWWLRHNSWTQDLL